MILVCPNCSTSYVTEVQFPPEGRKVRCAKCSHVWRAMPDDDASLVPAPEPEAETNEARSDQPPAESEQTEPSTEQPAAESAEEPPQEDRPAEDEQPAETEPDADAASDAQTDESETPSETTTDSKDDSDIVFNETEEPRAAPEDDTPSAEAAESEPPEEETSDVEAAEGEPPGEETPEEEASDTEQPEVEAADTEPVAEDAPKPEDEAETQEAVTGDQDEPSEAADAEWSVDEEPDAATTDVAPAEIVAPGSTEVATQPTAVAVTPTGPVVESTAEEVFVASEHGPKRSKGVGLALAWTALVLLVGGVGAAAYIYRFDVVRTVPAAAGAYRALGIPVNSRGLEIRDLAYSWEVESTRAVLVVQGQVVNITSEPLEVPQLVLALRDQELANLREVPANVGLRAPLQPGAEAQFRVRILAPPETTSNVFVRFAEAG